MIGLLDVGAMLMDFIGLLKEFIKKARKITRK